ncbi:unnamed protein product, partial [Discosporangium mesarthrocarpum]
MIDSSWNRRPHDSSGLVTVGTLSNSTSSATSCSSRWVGRSWRSSSRWRRSDQWRSFSSGCRCNTCKGPCRQQQQQQQQQQQVLQQQRHQEQQRQRHQEQQHHQQAAVAVSQVHVQAQAHAH